MNDKDRIEEYKLLVDIYYKEIGLSYTKATFFITIQLGVFAGAIAGYTILSSSIGLFCSGILLMIFISLIQLLMAIRAKTVNNALINTLTDFEEKNGYTLLKDFSQNVTKSSGIKKMNFPTYAMIVISLFLLFAWCTVLLIVLFPTIISKIPSSIGQVQPPQELQAVVICIFAMLYAVTMKISDLLDEHGLHLFCGAPYLFSFLCAVFGCLLIISDDVIANIIFAMIIGFVVRKRIDYGNHILAFLILSTCFLICSNAILEIYFPFLIIIVLLGFLKDTKYLNNKSNIINVINKIYLYVPIIYTFPSLIYSILSSNWVVFFAFFTYDLSYNITRLIGNCVMHTSTA